MNEDKQDGGARASVGDSRDPRLTIMTQWVWNVIQALMVLALCGVAKNLYEVNLTLATSTSAIADMKAQLAQHSADIRQLERDVAEVKGTAFRGVDGFDDPPKGEWPRRGH